MIVKLLVFSATLIINEVIIIIVKETFLRTNVVLFLLIMVLSTCTTIYIEKVYVFLINHKDIHFPELHENTPTIFSCW